MNPCEYCASIEAMTGTRNCPIHGAAPPIAGEADLEQPAVIDAQRVTLEFASRNPKRVDAGRQPIDESPLFGGSRQKDLFS
jgi:hypothetical protein